MTSRLKRKLGDIGVDTSSRKANENFCLIGTPLPPLEKSKDTGEFVPLWKQEVRDEKGRRRLHGAFTGGWSAGYFNTAGSKEGWTPSTFVSSRNERAKKQAARPEDFMDEEDLQDVKDSKKLVDATEEMDFLSGTQPDLRGQANDDDRADPITRALQATLLPAPKDSVGAKILKKMGWRLGQGIGPRISLKRRKDQDAQAYDPLTGNKVTIGGLDIQEDDDEASKHTYAPRDTPILTMKRKDNTHGLGYVPGMGLQESLGGESSQGNSDVRLAGGFGLGALNEADEDDLDVYDGVHKISQRRDAYDHSMGNDDDTIVLGGKEHKRTTAASASNASNLSFRDGRPVLTGFVLSEEPVARDIWFPLPDIPPGWKPNPKSLWAREKENHSVAPTQQAEPQPHANWKNSQLSADKRGSLLGETPLPSGPKSVFDYMSEKDKERIQRIASNLVAGKDLLASSSSSNPSERSNSRPTSTARLDPQIAQAALRGFQPFTSNPVKQARYTMYLQSHSNSEGPMASLQPSPGQKPEEFAKELEDYAKAASLFKPMSGAMAGRFTSAAVLDMGPEIVEGLHQPSQAELEASEKRKEEEEEREMKANPKVNAAKMGMYGPLTREVWPWVPARLLCKRFGVKEPDVHMDTATDAPPPQPNQPSFMQPEFGGPVGSVATSSGGTAEDPATTSSVTGGPRDITNIGLGEDETQGQDILTYQRPSIDIFKAIFASDDEDEDDADEENDDNGDVVSSGQTERKGFTSAATILDDTPVDPNTFKPTFIPRDSKTKRSKEGKGDKRKDKKDKKKKEKDKKSVLVSFEMEEDGGADGHPQIKRKEDRPSKKRRRDSAGGDMQVDKPPPPEVDDGPISVGLQEVGAAVKARKRAVDFMD